MSRAGKHVMECPVSRCHYEMVGPHQPMKLGQCGHTISRGALETIVRRDAGCPICGAAGSPDISTYRRHIKLTCVLETHNQGEAARFRLPEAVLTTDSRSEIGRGGTGIVYRGKLDIAGALEAVAVKVLRTRDQSPAFSAHVNRELQLMCLVSQTLRGLLVGVHGYVETPDAVLLVLELSQRSLLSELQQAPVGKIPCISAEHWVQLAIQLAEALEALHDLGICHRAVTPSNVLMARNGTYKLADAGLAHICAAAPGFISQPGHALNYAYIAPEQYKRTTATTEKSDVWGFGAVMYHAWAGEPPFGAASAPEIVEMHNARQLPELDGSHLKLPQPLKRILQSCFAYDAARRPSAAALVAQLRQAQDTLAVSNAAPPATSTPPSALQQPAPPQLQDPEDSIIFYIKSSDGDRMPCKVRHTTKFEEVIDFYCQRKGIERNNIRFFLDGDMIHADQTAGERGLRDGYTIDALPVQAGSIGVWAAPSTVGQVGDRLLQRLSAPCSAACEEVLNIIRAAEGPSPGRRSPSPRADVTSTLAVLAEDVCVSLVAVIERRFLEEAAVLPAAAVPDFVTNCRFELSCTDLIALIGKERARAVAHLVSNCCTDLRYFLRRVAASDAESKQPHLAFHRDSAAATASISLNSAAEYEGAELMFACDDGRLYCPSRPLGAAVVHSGRVVHGVSRLESGVRYNLFVQRDRSVAAAPSASAA